MKKRKYVHIFLVVLLCAISLTACGGNREEKGDSAQVRTDGEESFPGEADEEWKEASRRIILEAGGIAEEVLTGLPEESRYPKIVRLPRKWIDLVMYSEGCYCIFDGSFYGFMTEDGEEIAPYIYERAFPFSEGLACVCLDGKYGYIGKDGETVIPFLYDQASPFTDGLAYFRAGKEYGFIDHEGKTVLQPDCDSISSFQEGRAYFSVDGLYGYLDRTGKILAEPVYEDAGYFREGLAIVMQNGCYGVIGADGEEVLPAEYGAVSVEDGYIMAWKDTLVSCFDREGRLCIEGEWNRIEAEDGLFVAGRDGKDWLFDGNGTVLLEGYDFLEPIPEKRLVIAMKDGSWGVVDYEGNERVPFSWNRITYEEEGTGGLRVVRDRDPVEGQEGINDADFGYLGFTEQGDFVEIPPIYDFLSFQGDRAVAGMDGKYGVIRRDGEIEIPLEYDNVKLFENGAVALRTGHKTVLYDSRGEAVYSEVNSGGSISIYQCGRGFRIEDGGKYGILDERGEPIVPLIYDTFSSYPVCGADDVFMMKQYAQSGQKLLVRVGEGDGFRRPEAFWTEGLLQNHITPRAEVYLEFLQDGVIGGAERLVPISELPQARRTFSKLYRVGEEVVLYFYSEPYADANFPESNSGFFVYRDGKMEELAAGSECGGSMRGDHICFWYDRKGSRRMLGIRGAWGGFGGYAYSGDVYELRSQGAELTASYSSVTQTSGNYSMEELEEDAGLFYDDKGRTYTAESIRDASSVTEYEVNGERTTQERFAETVDRYRYIDALELRYH